MNVYKKEFVRIVIDFSDGSFLDSLKQWEWDMQINKHVLHEGSTRVEYLYEPYAVKFVESWLKKWKEEHGRKQSNS